MNDNLHKDTRPALESQLAGLSREQLQSLLLKLAEQEPSLIPTIEKQVTMLRTSSSQPTTPLPQAVREPPPVVDTKVIRRQVRSSIHSLDRMRSSEAYWQVGAVVGEVGQLVDQAWALIKADDGRQALKVLEAITEEYLGEWENLDDSDGEASGFFSDLGPAWTEAVLSADLTREEREGWADRFSAWQGELEEYVTMLVRLGRVEEAIYYGLKYLATTEEALALAKALYEHGEHEQSLQMAEHGLSLEGRKASLAKWLRDQALSMGEKSRALPAAEAAFRDEISLENYQQVAEIAGEQWPERQAELLNYARQAKSSYPKGQIDVFLHEGLIEDAIGAMDSYASHTLVEQVVDAALQAQSHLDWVIEACRKQAEYIMDRGKADLYYSAATWLAKARKAYHLLGREGEWQTYLNELLNQHGRKYKLVPMLKNLR